MLLVIYFYVSRGTYLTNLSFFFILYIIEREREYFMIPSLFFNLLFFIFLYVYEKDVKIIFRKKYNFLLKLYGDEGYRSPCPSHAKRMLYHLSYIPLRFFFPDAFLCWPFLFPSWKNASGGVRTHASLDSRSWDGPLRPLGHECFSILLLYTLSCALTLFLF